MGLKQQAISGVKWTTLSSVINTGIQLIQLAILTRLLKATDFGLMALVMVICPIKQETYPYGGFTAGLVEAIRHAKPGVYPNGYIVPNELLSSSLFYDKIEELPKLIENNFLNSAVFLGNLLKNTRANSEKFSLQHVSNYFQESILQKVCESG